MLRPINRADAQSIASAAKANLDELSAMSADGLGVTRLAYGQHDALARCWFMQQCEDMGLFVKSDAVGNCFGLPVTHSGHKPLLIGSHLDSVPNGGRFDGTLGVALGLNVTRWFLDKGEDIPLAVASFACEESSRFGFGSIGSRGFVGDLTEESFESLIDQQGNTLGSVLAEAGFEGRDGEGFGSVADFGSYLEVHIDQGTTLMSMGSTIGVVTGIAGVHRSEFTWIGEEAHSGGRLRSDRRDALLAAAEFIIESNELWREVDVNERDLSVTIGRLSVKPNSPNTVPGRVELIVDIRSVDLEAIDSMVRRLEAGADRIAESHRIALRKRTLGRVNPLAMAGELVEVFDAAAQRLEIQAPHCISLAGHDALVVGRSIPAAMLLLANPTGISHSPEESVDEKAIVDCAAVLVEAILDLVALDR